MSKEKILVVEDGQDIANLLKLYFTAQGYEVLLAPRGQVALDICRTNPPNLILLDVGLPDMDGYALGKALRSNRRTHHIPIVFLTAHGERKDRLRGLGEVQAQYYVVKPFDIEELRAIVKNQLDEARRKNESHPVTSLPTAEMINEQLRGLIHSTGWALALVRIAGFEAFSQTYGAVVGEDVLRFVAPLLHQALAERGDPDDFVGQIAVDPEFVIISSPSRIQRLCEQISAGFNDGIARYYAFHDRQRGYLEIIDDTGGVRQMPFLSLSIGILTSNNGPFADIRQLLGRAEELCQQAPPSRREHTGIQPHL